MSAANLPDHGAQLRAELLDVRAVLRGLGLLDGAVREASGRRFKIRCPWHHEKTPSCAVDVGPKEGTLRARCFSCGQGGDVLALIAAVHRLDGRRDYQRILELGAELARVSLDFGPASPARAPAARTVPRPASPPPAPSVAPEAFARGVQELLAALPLGGSLAGGIEARGVLDEARADGWGALPTGAEAARLCAELKGRPELAWLLAPVGFRLPEHRLLIPWRAPGGRIWTLQRRYAPVHGAENPPREGFKYALPPGDAHRPRGSFPYGADSPELASADEVWIVEGAVDVLAVRALNARGLLAGGRRRLVALGLPGLGAWGQVKDWTLEQVRGRPVYLALDADEAGQEATARIGADCHRAGASKVRRQRPGSGFKDWGEAAAARIGQAREPAPKAKEPAEEPAEESEPPGPANDAPEAPAAPVSAVVPRLDEPETPEEQQRHELQTRAELECYRLLGPLRGKPLSPPGPVAPERAASWWSAYSRRLAAGLDEESADRLTRTTHGQRPTKEKVR